MNSSAVSIEVSRDNIYNDLINCFKKRINLSHPVMVTFEGEGAGGDGVWRDALSAFYQKMYSKLDGELCKVLSRFDEEEELEIIGKIIHAGFIQYYTFSVQLCKATLEYYLFGNVDKEDLITAFMDFLPEREVEWIREFKSGPDKNIQPILDIFF